MEYTRIRVPRFIKNKKKEEERNRGETPIRKRYLASGRLFYLLLDVSLPAVI